MRRPQRGEGRASISTWNLGGRGAEKREEREEGGGRRGRGRGAQALPFASVIIVISFEFDYGQKRIRGNRKETCKSLGNDGMGGICRVQHARWVHCHAVWGGSSRSRQQTTELFEVQKTSTSSRQGGPSRASESARCSHRGWGPGSFSRVSQNDSSVPRDLRVLEQHFIARTFPKPRMGLPCLREFLHCPLWWFRSFFNFIELCLTTTQALTGI